jgi:hypothetical protein
MGNAVLWSRVFQACNLACRVLEKGPKTTEQLRLALQRQGFTTAEMEGAFNLLWLHVFDVPQTTRHSRNQEILWYIKGCDPKTLGAR